MGSWIRDWSATRRPDIQVLVVEDDASTQATLVALVKKFGVDVRVANDGEAAYSLVLDRPPDLILCDVEMPALDEASFIRRLRRDPRFRRILAIAATGRGRALDMATTRAAGFDGHIVKPVTPEALARLLDRAVDLHQARDHGQGA